MNAITNIRTRPVGVRVLRPTESGPKGGRILLGNCGALPSRADAAASLTSGEQSELTHCETVIARGWENFIEVGEALRTIRDRRLYREHHPSFEAYCINRWQYRRSYAYYLVGAAEVIGHLSGNDKTPLPRCEAQVRPLIGLPPDTIREVWTEVVKGTDIEAVTAKVVRDKAAAYKPHPSIRVKPGAGAHAGTATTDLTAESVQAIQVLEKLEQALRDGAATDTILHFVTGLRVRLQRIAAGATTTNGRPRQGGDAPSARRIADSQ